MSRRTRALGFIVLAGLAALSPTAASAAGTQRVTVVAPPPASALRTAVLDAIRRHTGSTDKFLVTRLNVGSKKGQSLAFFSGRPECCEGTDYILKKIGTGSWKVVWSLGRGGGSGDCMEFADSDQRAIRTITSFGLNANTFAPELLEARDYELDEAAAGNECIGDSGIG